MNMEYYHERYQPFYFAVLNETTGCIYEIYESEKDAVLSMNSLNDKGGFCHYVLQRCRIHMTESSL